MQGCELNTLPELLLNQVGQRGSKTAIRKKEFGIWHSWTWKDVGDQVRAFACGLAAKGFVRGDNLAVVGDIRARLYWAITAAQSLGGVAVPLYSDASADEIARILKNIKTRFVVVQDQEQVDKFIKIKAECPSLEEIIFVDPRGMRHYSEPYLAMYEDIRRLGHEFDLQHPRYFLEQAALGSGEDIAFILHTAGSTGDPKAVMLSHSNVIATAQNSIAQLTLEADEQVLAFMPMAMGTSILFYLVHPLIAGFCVNFPESSETVLADMQDIGPTIYFAPPQFYKSLFNLIMVQMTEASAIKRYFFNGLSRKPSHTTPSILDKLLIVGPLKNVFGLSRIRTALTTGDSTSPAVQDFYRSLGINLRHFYGPTEGCCFVTLQPDKPQEKPGNVGVAVKGVEISINPQGEVVFRGPNSFHGYYNNSEATLAIKGTDGWTKTGDAGFFDKDGCLNIVGPLTDRSKLINGNEFFSSPIESRLKFSPYIKEAVAIGNERAYITAIINIDTATVANWAKQHNLAYTGYSDLAQHDAVYALIQEAVKDVNKYFHDSGQPNLQILQFVVSPKFFNAAAGEMTLTGKLRRTFIREQYADIIEAMYADTVVSAFIAQSELRRLTWNKHNLVIKACAAYAY